jgi:hypothetical protein
MRKDPLKACQNAFNNISDFKKNFDEKLDVERKGLT